MTDYRLSSVPEGSKLILMGDWFRNPGQRWHVVCYFSDAEKKVFRKPLPVDLIPALTLGASFPRTSCDNDRKRYTGRFIVPPMDEWEKVIYADLPTSLKRLHEYSDQIGGQVVYRFNSNERVIWLPATELARMLYFHSSEVTKSAVYEGNTWQLAKADQEDWIGEVKFTSNVPVNYLNSLQFRKFFAWLLFNSGAQESFGSIFKLMNEQTVFNGHHERWTFDFEPPDLSACEISWAGYTGREQVGEQHHCFVREVLSVAGIKAPELDVITFSHPDDIFYMELEDDENESGGENSPKKRPVVNPKEIDTQNAPGPSKKRYLIKITSSGFHFDTEIDLRRSPRHVQALPKGESPQLEENQEEETLGILEVDDKGKGPRGDVDNLDEKDYVDAPEKLALFQAMLEKLEQDKGWPIQYQFGEVPKNRCRSAHLVDGRRRKYCHAVIQRDSDTTVQVLEIELTQKEKLSTLFYRAEDTTKTLAKILDAFMTSDSSRSYKAMKWKRFENTELTIARVYLDHPDKKIKAEIEALEAWYSKAKDKIVRL